MKRAKVEKEREREKGREGEQRRSSLDVPRTNTGSGFARRGAGERKRWSICGGERRGDLDLETIWED
ncbi:hypothetical protein LTR28_010501 [Elasticomyces elasticus]|nr:hypothetical protein LTR28_010501 [Elasticomyces elasticus]